MGRGAIHRLLILTACAATAACASLPAAAPQHARLLGQYHQQTAAATLGVIDLLGDSLATLADAVRRTTDEDWSNYTADSREAATRFGRIRDALAALPAPPSELARLAAESADLFTAHATTADTTRQADSRALADHERAARASVAALRAAVAEHQGIISAQLDRLTALLDSHVNVESARDAALGVELAGRLADLRSRSDRFANIAGDTAGRLDDALRALRAPPSR